MLAPSNLNEQQINVLKEQIELQKLQNHHEGTGVELPSGVKMDASKDPESQELIERVELLERERAELLKQLSSNVVSSLDPASEVSTLLKKSQVTKIIVKLLRPYLKLNHLFHSNHSLSII